MTFQELMKLNNNQSNFERLVNLCNKRKVIPFVGAGLSCPIYPLWSTVLLNMCHGNDKLEKSVEELLNKNQFETAASEVYKENGPGAFYDYIYKEFNCKKITDTKLKGMAVSILPEIFQEMVLTTNFDDVLESVYERSNIKFEAIRPYITQDQGRSELVNQALKEGSHYLFQIHGSWREKNSLVLTEESYDKTYGKKGKRTTFYTVLYDIMQRQSILMMGCSIGNDRTIEMLAEIIQKSVITDDLVNFAIVQLPKDKKQANIFLKKLSDLYISPIVYPEGDHDCVKLLLRKLSRIVNNSNTIKVKKKVNSTTVVSYAKYKQVQNQQLNNIGLEKIIMGDIVDAEDYQKLFQEYFIEPTFDKDKEYEKLLGELLKSKGQVFWITGERGVGKSTILKKLFWDLQRKNIKLLWLDQNLIFGKKGSEYRTIYSSLINATKNFTNRNKIYFFIDGVDEFVSIKELDKFLKQVEKYIGKKINVIISCRVQFINRYFMDKIKYWNNIWKVSEWDKDKQMAYVNSYLKNISLQGEFWNLYNSQEGIRILARNPFQMTLMLYLFKQNTEEYKTILSNVYSLYNMFYNRIVDNEIMKCFISKKKVEEVHYKYAKKLYENNGKEFLAVRGGDGRQNIELYNSTPITCIMKIKIRPDGKSVVTGFYHSTFIEYLLVKKVVQSALKGKDALLQSIHIIYRHFEFDFFEDAFCLLSNEKLNSVCQNFEGLYEDILYYEKKMVKNDIISIREKKILDKCNRQEVYIIKDQLLHIYGRLPVQVLKSQNKLYEMYYGETDILLKINIATIAINHNICFEIEEDYINKIINNIDWNFRIRSWALAYWSKEIVQNPYEYEDMGGDWSCVREKRLERIEKGNKSTVGKYVNTRAIDLAQLLVFFENRGWNTMKREDFEKIRMTTANSESYCKEKQSLISYLLSEFSKHEKDISD